MEKAPQRQATKSLRQGSMQQKRRDLALARQVGDGRNHEIPNGSHMPPARYADCIFSLQRPGFGPPGSGMSQEMDGRPFRSGSWREMAADENSSPPGRLRCSLWALSRSNYAHRVCG